MSDAEPSPAVPGPVAPKRRGKGRKRHTVAKVVVASLVVLAMATGLSVVFIYRHLNGNLNVQDLSGQLGGDRPDKKYVAGSGEPLNILVMGSDARDCKGCNIDNLTGMGQRSDTTILLHLSADRTRAYGISVPRDSMVDRPTCLGANGETIPGGTHVMWNEAFSIGGPACTMKQFESLTGIRLDHYVVVNFEGFKSMVDAIGGVEVCIPEPGFVDPAHGINLPAGTRKLEGVQALNYVRERYEVGNGSDIGRMKRQQAFIASMAHQVVSAGTLSRPDRIVSFLDAATKSLTTDLPNLVKIGQLGYEFRNIGLDHIQFLTIPNTVDPTNPNHLVWTPQAKRVWRKIIDDEPLTKRLATDVITAGNVPGGSHHSGGSGHSSGSPSGGSSSGSSGTAAQGPSQQELADAGLCA
ncbi:LCP family protein [Nocardioides panaciterrulae]|uniref:LCP family protein required for cell wall assembly n=1 Tax=Nocardioides panaciterrulae TaxID=661492 RepID=A0A7Y9E987_9ACTN|nr:LCP family protein [Nocardioides panaciterrulae]NYD43337.1 LCP family protein required for cell wall assembly [Nocardioides panaciterrulae]